MEAESIFQTIVRLQKHLLRSEIHSIVIGGIAVAVWGEPRLTRDIDLKILLGRDEGPRLIQILSPHYRPLVSEPVELLRRSALVFVRDAAGTRIDLLLAETPFDITAVERGQDLEIQPGASIRVCSAEDLIIYKLISTRLRDHEDAISVIRRQGDKIDEIYVLDWLTQFERALDDSTLVSEFTGLISKGRGYRS